MIQGTGELRNTHGAYRGHVVMGGRTIVLKARVDQDVSGRFLKLDAYFEAPTPEQMAVDLIGPAAPEASGNPGLSMSDLALQVASAA